MAHHSPHAITLCIKILVVPKFTFVNQHGPFTLREREALDAWIASVPNVGIVGGDFNDGIWHASRRRRRIWHDCLAAGRLTDPQYQTVPQPQGPSHTRGGKRLDALLLSQTAWNALTPVACQATTFPSAGDHAGVEIHTTVILPEPQSPDSEIISIRDWTGRDLKRFRAHMGRWYRGVPKNMTAETASNMVPKEVARYVAAHKKPDRRLDQTHQDLQARLGQNPCDQAALKQWGEHMQRKHHTEVMKNLRLTHRSFWHAETWQNIEGLLWIPLRVPRIIGQLFGCRCQSGRHGRDVGGLHKPRGEVREECPCASNCGFAETFYIYYYTPLPLNLANNNNKQQQQQHVSLPFWPLLRPNASDLLSM